MFLSFMLNSNSPDYCILIVPATVKKSGTLKIPFSTFVAAEDCFIADKKGKVQQGIPCGTLFTCDDFCGHIYNLLVDSTVLLFTTQFMRLCLSDHDILHWLESGQLREQKKEQKHFDDNQSNCRFSINQHETHKHS